MNARNEVSGYLEKAKNAFHSGGLWLFLKRCFRKTRRSIFRTNSAFWYIRDLSLGIKDIEPKIPVEIDWDFSKTIEWIRGKADLSESEKREMEIAIREKHYLPNVKYNGDIIGYIKVGHGEVYILDFESAMKFKERTAFIYDSHTIPEFRGLGVTPYLVTNVMRFLKERGYDRILCHIPAWNRASARAYSKCDFKKIKGIRYCRALGMRWFSTHPEKL